MKTATRKALLSAAAVVAGIAGSMALSAFGTAALPAYAAGASTTPVISGISATTQLEGTGGLITWATDIPSSSRVNYGTSTAYGTYSMLGDTTTPVTNHSVTLFSLMPSTTYHFVVLSGVDAASSTASSSMAMSSDQSFTTSSTSSATTSAPIITNVTAAPTDTGATITWTTDRPASTQVVYGLTNNYGATTTLNTASTTNHSASLNGLNADTVYRFAVLSGNSGGVSRGVDQTFTTLTSTGTGDSIPGQIAAL